jgi:uncharacterized protein YgbK (DUF1537 family)
MGAAPAVRVIADDLTGACEIAALGFRLGIPSTVCLDSNAAVPEGPGMWVLDTETRLLEPTAAAARIRTVAARVAAGPPSNLLYKKTDSVLRGPVAAELVAWRRTLGAPQLLFVPVNPALGRIIRNGQYFIDETPLDRTDFANDPHHPATTSDVITRLREDDADDVFSANCRRDAISSEGILVGDAESTDDLSAWSDHWRENQTILAAGGAAWFEVLLRDLTHHASVPARRPPSPFDRTTLFLSGTRSVAQHSLVEQLQNVGKATHLFEPTAADSVQSLLERDQRAALFYDERHAGPGDAKRIRETMATLAQAILARGKVTHLVIEGGATAAAVSDQMGWKTLEVVADWGGGIVSLCPPNDPSLWVTLKPGSYPWPVIFRKLLF